MILDTRYGQMSAPDEKDDLLIRFLIQYGEWAWQEVMFISENLRDNAQVADVGAFLGTFGIGLSMLRTVSNICFVEPNQMVLPHLRSNTAANCRSTHAVVEAALWPESEEVKEGYYSPGNIGSFSFAGQTEHPSASIIGSRPPSVLSLSNLVAEYGPFDLIKLDIEKMEERVLFPCLSQLVEAGTMLWVEALEAPGTLALAEALSQAGYNVHYFAFNSFNSRNYAKNATPIFPIAYEAGLLATTGAAPMISHELSVQGAMLRTIRNREDLKRALWLTPRWGMPEWKGKDATELAALAGRYLHGDKYASFLDGQPPPQQKGPASQTDNDSKEEQPREIDLLRGDIGAMNLQISEFSQVLLKSNQNAESVAKQLKSLAAQLMERDQTALAGPAAIAQRDRRISELNDAASRANERATSLAKQVETFAAQAAERDIKLTELTKDSLKGNGVIQALGEKIHALTIEFTRRVEIAEAETGELQAKLSGCENRIAGLQGDLCDRDARIASMAQELTAAREKIDEYSRTLSVRESRSLIGILKYLRKKTRAIRYPLMGKRIDNGRHGDNKAGAHATRSQPFAGLLRGLRMKTRPFRYAVMRKQLPPTASPLQPIPGKSAGTNHLPLVDTLISLRRKTRPIRYFLMNKQIPPKVVRPPHILETTGKATSDAKRGLIESASSPRVIAATWMQKPGQATVGRSEILNALTADGGGRPAGLAVSLSHDDYTSVPGGIQVCVGDEEMAFRRAGWAYLHAHPTQPLPMLADVSPAEKFLVTLTMNGRRIGRARMIDLISVVRDVRQRGTNCWSIVWHLLGYAPEHVAILAQCCAPEQRIVCIHDFFTLCPNWQLLRNGATFCHAPPITSAACKICCYGSERQSHVPRIEALFAATNPIVMAPSQFAMDFWTHHGKLAHTRKIVSPNCRVVLDTPVTPNKAGPHDAPLRVAYLGAPQYFKGWTVYARLARQLTSDPRYSFFQLGVSDRALPEEIKNVTVRVSQADRDAMVKAITDHGIDAVILWSMSASETFCIAAHEALAAGAFVVTRPDAGNIWHAVSAIAPGQGIALPDEDALLNLFSSGKILSLAAAANRKRGKLHPHGHSASFVLSKSTHPEGFNA